MGRWQVRRKSILIVAAVAAASVAALLVVSAGHRHAAPLRSALWVPAPSGLVAQAAPVGTAGATSAATHAAKPAAVHVVRELVGKRTASSITYRLSNGLNETHFYGEAVNYRAADGSWKRIDTNLVADTSGALHTAATPGSLTVASKSGSAAPVRLARKGGSLGIDVLGVSEKNPSASGSSATYAAAPGVSLSYRALSAGVEQTAAARRSRASSSARSPCRTPPAAPPASRPSAAARPCRSPSAATPPTSPTRCRAPG